MVCPTTSNIACVGARTVRSRWHLARAVPLRDADGEIAKWFGTCTDIHEQKRAETILREHQLTLENRITEREAEAEHAMALYQLLAENATDMVSTKHGRHLRI